MSTKGKLFLIHWNKPEVAKLAAPLRQAGWQVESEAEDGARAGKRILANPPAAVVIYLTRLPSHGRETAHALRSAKAAKRIPVIFVDGAEDKVAKVRANVPDGIFTTSAKLPQVLARLESHG